MTIQDDIKKLTDEVKELEDKSADLHTDAYTLRQKREALVAKMVLDEKMLLNTNWEIKAHSDGSAVLEYKDKGLGGPLTFVENLSKTDYHSWFDLADGIQLRFDDEDISISFQEAKQVLPFVKKNGLVLSGTGIRDRLAKLKREVAGLEDICHTFNIY